MVIRLDEELLDELSRLDSIMMEDHLYRIAILEIQEEQLDLVAQAKAFEEAEGDVPKARALYTKHRVQRIRDMLAQYKAVHIAQAKAESQKKREAKRAEATEQVRSFFKGIVRKVDLRPKEPVAVYKHQSIYKTGDGYKAMGALFETIEQARVYIDNNLRIRR